MFDQIREFFSKICKSRLFVLILCFCIMFAILIQRVFYLQIVKGQEYVDEYQLQIQKTKDIQGTRGNIYDCNGELLAYNDLAYSITIEDNGSYDTQKEKNSILNETILYVVNVVKANGDVLISDFGVQLDAAGAYAFVDSGNKRLRFLADVYGYTTIDKLSEKQKKETAADLIDYLCTDDAYGYGIDRSSMDPTAVLELVTVRYNMGLNQYQKYISTTIAADVSDESVATVEENKYRLQGVDVEEDYMRRYTDSKYFSSFLGYTGKISEDEYASYMESGQKSYSLTDVIGKAGIEQSMDTYLQGEKGKEVLYVDSVGKVIDSVKTTEANAGKDVYLTVDKNLQEAAYNIIEQKLAGIVVAKMQNVMNYDPTTAGDSKNVIIPMDDVYHSFYNNDIINLAHLTAEDAQGTERAVGEQVNAGVDNAVNVVMGELQNAQAAPYQQLSPELQSYMTYIVTNVLTNTSGILQKDAIDTNDDTYKAWTNDGSVSLYGYLNYAISQNWIDTAFLQSYIDGGTTDGKYSDSAETYQAILQYLKEYLSKDSGFKKLVIKYLIKSESITGTQTCLILYEQGFFAADEEQYNNLASGVTGPYDFIRDKISSLEITPGQLGLEPCSGSAVITDVNTGKLLACVSYPGYDNNRLSNNMDTAYYNQLLTSTSSPFYNKATQEKTAPGSTYKMVSAVTGLTEGVIDTGTYFDCEGEFDLVTPSAKCWIYPGAHGSLNVTGAIENSCNVFFYTVGYRLGQREDGSYSSDQGIARLAKYANEFGFGSQSGIEIPEADPQISDTASVPSAIGQGTNNFTTTQMARYVTTVANRGTVYDLTLIDHIADTEGKTVKSFEPKIANKMTDVSVSTWDAVQQGMVDVVQSSSTFANYNTYDVLLAGKTGTAQQSKTHPDHVLFVGYAPADKPEIALAVRIANGYNSTYSAEVGRDIVMYRYGLGDANELLNGNASTIGTGAAGD